MADADSPSAAANGSTLQSPVEARPTRSAVPAEVSGDTKNVSRRIARRTTDLIAIAILTVGILTVSGRISGWWTTSEEEILSSTQTAAGVAGAKTTWSDRNIPITLGSSTLPVRLERLSFRGERDEVDELVLKRLRELLQLSRPVESLSPLNEAEERLLASLTKIDPIETPHAGDRIYRLDEPGTQTAIATFLATRGTIGPNLKYSAPHRVICWAMATAFDKSDWRVFFFVRTNESNQGAGSIALPEGVRVVFTLSDPEGGSLTAVEAEESYALTLDQWAARFERQLSSSGWQQIRQWTESGESRSSRFRRVIEDQRKEVDVILRQTNDEPITGIVSVTGWPGRQSDRRD